MRGYAEEVSGPLLVMFKDGSTRRIASIDGGGMMLGGDPDSLVAGYEVHGTALDGQLIELQQASIAAVLDLDSMEQVEFGNPLVATVAGHPRGTRTA